MTTLLTHIWGHYQHRINRYARLELSPLHLLSVEPLSFDEIDLADNVGMRKTAQTLGGLTKGYLPQTLEQLELDVVSVTYHRISASWEHGQILKQRVLDWLAQFEKVGGNRWIGENLLKVLDFWSTTDLRLALRLSPEGINGFDCLSVSGEKVGASGDVLANRIKKQLDDAVLGDIPLRSFRDGIVSDESSKILFLEDCLLTGNEMSRVFNGLLGIKDGFDSEKAKRLDDPALLRGKEIWLRFAVATNWGVTALTRYIDDGNLWNTHLEPTSRPVIEVLTEDGISALKDGTLLDDNGCVIEPDRNVIRVAFTSLDVWSSPERREKAIAICQELGRQLFENFRILRQKTYNPKWVDEAGLGVQGLSLALAFSHSIPKSTLPLFWMYGSVTYEGRTFDWLPLFPAGL
ncbi:MAG: phosphoribosyltransferase-like protein [Thermomicrobiales bacterium]